MKKPTLVTSHSMLVKHISCNMNVFCAIFMSMLLDIVFQLIFMSWICHSYFTFVHLQNRILGGFYRGCCLYNIPH